MRNAGWWALAGYAVVVFLAYWLDLQVLWLDHKRWRRVLLAVLWPLVVPTLMLVGLLSLFWMRL